MSVGSVKVTVRPSWCMSSRSRLNVPPYTSRLLTMWPPWLVSASSVVVMAAIPEEKTRALSVFSSEAIFSCTVHWLGLPYRP